MRPIAHPRQAERLAALRRYDILDTPREEEFDEVVSLVSRVCDAPIAVINLIDADRQWFKAEVGLGVRETPLDASICGHVILGQDFVEIPDTLSDDRLADNPLCLAQEAPLRFYAGALLKTSEGLPIGTLCVLDHKPRTLDALQRDAVRVLARQVMRQLDLRLALKRQDLLRREVDHRVSNSLSIVSAMVRLQSRAAEGSEAKAALNATEARIDAVSALHAEMHGAGTGDDVELSGFFRRLERHLESSAPDGVSVRMRFDEVEVEPKVAASLAIIANEFVANSFKHAFPEGRRGVISVDGKVTPDGLAITAEDDGVGVPSGEGANGERRSGLGTRIIRASADRIGAKVELSTSETGARMILTVPLAPPPAPAG